MKLLPIGSTAYCSSHKGTLVAYFYSKDPNHGDHELYGVLFLDKQYKAEMPNGSHCYIRHLVVHHSNLTNNDEFPGSY